MFRTDKYLKKLSLPPKLITITDVALDKNYIKCSYNFIFATRMHHLSNKDRYFLPKDIGDSFAMKYFSQEEQNFILACDSHNDAIEFSKNTPNTNISSFYTGNEIIIVIPKHNNSHNMLKFQITDLSKFIGLCRRYNSPTEAEKIISTIFNKEI